jgi:type IV pilus assembly protein PilA
MKTAVRMKSQAGFSLIELMIVVAIIGILATIAIPNFQRFQLKARQSEAKTSLSAIFTGEKAFKAEFDSFISCMQAIGFTPEGSTRYAAGFSATHVTAAMVNGYSGGCTANRPATFGTSVAPAGTSTTVGTGGNFVAAAAAGTTQGFTGFDRWTIDDQRQLTNTVSGL